jgi:hypothetical protein
MQFLFKFITLDAPDDQTYTLAMMDLLFTLIQAPINE